MRKASLAAMLEAGLAAACLLSAGGSEARTIRVRMVDMAFEPAAIAAAAGDVVEWSNEDFVDHTATGSDGSFDVVIPAGKHQSVTLKQTGLVPYVCRFHPTMTGTITVE